MKSTNATINRPEGEREIDAPYVCTDFTKRIEQLLQEESWHKNDRNAVTIFKSEGLSVVLTALHSGAVVDDNTTNGVIAVQVLQGKIKIDMNHGNAQELSVTSQQMITIHRQFDHTICAEEDSVVLLMITGE